MRSEGSDDSGEDTSSSVHRPSDGHHPGDLEGMVDELEQRVVAERRSAAAQGNAGRGVRRRRAGTPARTRSSSPRVARGKEGHIVRDMTWPDTVGGEYFFSGSFSTWARNAGFVTSLPGLAREARS